MGEGTAADSKRVVEGRSALDRVLGVIAEVKAGEGATALLLATALFLLMMAYYIIKPVREALILQHPRGAEYKSWLGGAIAAALLLVVPLYSRLADRLPRNRLIVGVTLFFATHPPVFYLLSRSDGARQGLWLSLVFFIWVGIFSMMLVAQLWAFGNDVYTQEQGKRLFAVVGLGASVGAIAGGVVKSLLSNVFDMFEMLLVSAAALVGVAVIAQVVHLREVSRRRVSLSPVPPSRPDGAVPDRSGAFAMVLRHRYLRLIAAFSLIFTLVNTNGEYILGKLVREAGEGLERDALIEFIGGRYNSFFQWVNILGFVFQSLLVSRLIKRFGMSKMFLVLPVIALFDGAAVAVVPVLSVLFVGKIAENATDYSLNNTLRHMLWLPTTRDMKYKAKQAVDTFFVRMGDVGSTLCVTVGANLLGYGVRAFALFDVVLVSLWIGLAFAINKARRELEGEAPTVVGRGQHEREPDAVTAR